MSTLSPHAELQLKWWHETEELIFEAEANERWPLARGLRGVQRNRMKLLKKLGVTNVNNFNPEGIENGP